MYGITAQLPASKRRRARLDNQAAAQSNYRRKLKDEKAPDREAFGAAALTVALLMVHNDPNNEIVASMRRAVVGELVRAGFDANQALGRFDKMVEWVHRDREARQRRREWHAEHGAVLEASGNGD